MDQVAVCETQRTVTTSSQTTHLVLPVVVLRVLYDTVAELEEVAHGLVPLLHQVLHVEQWLPAMLEWDAQHVEDLERAWGFLSHHRTPLHPHVHRHLHVHVTSQAAHV